MAGIVAAGTEAPTEYEESIFSEEVALFTVCALVALVLLCLNWVAWQSCDCCMLGWPVILIRTPQRKVGVCLCTLGCKVYCPQMTAAEREAERQASLRATRRKPDLSMAWAFQAAYGLSVKLGKPLELPCADTQVVAVRPGQMKPDPYAAQTGAQPLRHGSGAVRAASRSVERRMEEALDACAPPAAQTRAPRQAHAWRGAGTPRSWEGTPRGEAPRSGGQSLRTTGMSGAQTLRSAGTGTPREGTLRSGAQSLRTTGMSFSPTREPSPRGGPPPRGRAPRSGGTPRGAFGDAWPPHVPHAAETPGGRTLQGFDNPAQRQHVQRAMAERRAAAHNAAVRRPR